MIPIRHPLEVAASLHHREGFSEDKSVYLWLRHTVDAIRDSRSVPRAIILFDELMRDWRAAVERLGSDLHVRWPKKLDALRGFPEVRAVHSTNGRWDIVAELGTDGLEAFDAALRRIRTVTGIANTETSLLLSTHKL